MNIVLNYSPIALFLIMIGIGMSVNIKSLIEVYKNLKVLLTGLLLQMLILPTIGLCFAIFALKKHRNMNILVSTPHNTLVIMWGRNKNCQVSMIYECRNCKNKI